MAGISRRRMLALGATALPAGLVVARLAKAQGLPARSFSDAPLAPQEARGNPEHRFWRDLLDEFPLEPERYHFDSAEHGIPPLQTLEHMHRVGREVAGGVGTGAAALVEAARESVARFIGAEPGEIFLARDALEAMSLFADALPFRPSVQVALSEHEPSCSLVPWVARAREGRAQLRFVAPASISAGSFASGSPLEGVSALVLSHVLPTTGAVLPLAEISRAAHARKMWVIADGSYAVGMQAVDVRRLGVDVYVASGSGWLLGPEGTAFAYARREILPLLRARYGHFTPADVSKPTEDASGRTGSALAAARDLELVPRSASLMAGLAASIDWVAGLGVDIVRQQATALATRLHEGVAAIPGIEVLSSRESAGLSPIVTFRVGRRPNTEIVTRLLQTHGIRLQHIDTAGLNAVRASTHLVNRPADVERLIEGIRSLA